MTYTVRPAKRSEAKPLIGFYSESGGGKTHSALLLARGFVGTDGRIIMIETESGRGEAFCDKGEYPEIGGYDVVSMRGNFSPKAYGEAITAAEKAGAQALIIDSASHEWEGAGGVLQMAEAQAMAGRKGVLIWQKPKGEHLIHFMLRFMQTPIPLVILCMRAKYPMKEIRQPDGKKEWVRSDQLEPKQADDILFEMFIHGFFDKNEPGVFHLVKSTRKGLQPVFAGNPMITLETGRQLASHCADKAAPAAEAPSKAPEAPSSSAKGAPPPPADYGIEMLREKGRSAAALGVANLEGWWKGGLSKTQRVALGIPFLDELKLAAQKADEAADAMDDGAASAEAG
jgi:hypothetical protein